MKAKKRIIALLLCVLTLVGLMPTAAFAAEQNVTIESQTNSAFDYLEYYSSGGWHDLNTPKHTIEQTGEVVYGMMLSRWSNYAENGHGGNKELRKIAESKGFDYIKQNFQYSILENYNAKVDDHIILDRESWWKETLQSRLFGYNDN